MINAPGVVKLWAALPEARIVGGAVRDSLLGRTVADIDFASLLIPEEVMARLSAARIKFVPTGLAHGTVTAVIGGRGFEITTLRRDVAADGRHAVVAFTDNWEADAARRDFTINAMSMAQNGTLFDYFDGAADLRAGIVRFVGDARTRITEDYLRILRFFRFFARYANGTADAEAVNAIIELRQGISQLSVERIWSELKNILSAADPSAAIALMQQTGVLESVISEGADGENLTKLIARKAPVDPLLRFAALLKGDADAVAARLKLSNAELEILQSYRLPNALAPGVDDAGLRRALAETDTDTLIARIWLGQDDAPDWEELRTRLSGMARPVFPCQGRDITALGISPGPRVGEILHAVRHWWLDGGCVADEQACRQKALHEISTAHKIDDLS